MLPVGSAAIQPGTICTSTCVVMKHTYPPLPSPPLPSHTFQFQFPPGIAAPHLITSNPSSTMFTTRLLQSAARTYKARHPWPPDFTLLSQKEQFRLERRYRRRAKLKWARPQLMKAVTFAQWGSVACLWPY